MGLVTVHKFRVLQNLLRTPHLAFPLTWSTLPIDTIFMTPSYLAGKCHLFIARIAIKASFLSVFAALKLVNMQ